ncbi:alpha/beta hydrolase [Candidatus Woesebacteria bacterium]|nr:alpha/beta hydrolase [Candidatus Woesebacteria bacterium]
MSNSPVYIIHGWTAAKETKTKWQPFIDLLVEQGFAVTFLALPGLLKPLEESWNLDQYVEWVHGKVKKDKPVILIGHSFGGQVATRLSYLYPKDVSRLVLIDSSGIPDARWTSWLKRRVFLYLAKLGKPFASNPALRNIFYKFVGERDYYKATPAQRKTMQRVIRTDLRSIAPAVHQQVLIVWGEHDQTTPLAMGQTFLQLLPQSTLHIIAGARHSPQYTHVAEVVEAIGQWLRLLGERE